MNALKTYSLVLKTVLKNSFRASKNKYIDYGDEKTKKKQKATKAINAVMIALGFVVMFAVIYIVVHVLAMMVAIENMSSYFLSMLLTTGQLMILFFGLSAVLSNTFFSKDNEFLASLPVKPEIIFAVKMTVIYINEFIVSTLFLLPMLAAFISGSIIGGVSIPIHFYFLIPLILIVEPVVPLVLISIISFPLIKVVSYFKNRSAITLIVSLLAFVLLMALYMAFVPNIEKFFSMDGQISLLTPQLKNTIYGMGKVVFYNRFFADALLGNRFWINMLILIATVAVATGLCVGLAAALYGKAAGKSGEETRKSVAVKIGTDIQGRRKTLFMREWRMLIRNQSFAFNSIMGSIITPVIILIMNFVGIGAESIATQDGTAMSAFASSFANGGFVLFYSVLLMCGTNYTASLAFSREGNTFYVLRYLPVSLKEIINAKVMLANAVSLLGLVLTALVSLIFTKLGFLNVFPMVIAIGLLQYGFNMLCVYRDLKKPNVNWTSAYEVIKKNLYPMIPMFGAMGLGIVFMFAAQLIAKYENAVSLKITVPIYWVLLCVIAVVLIAVVKLKMKKHAEEYFDRIAFDN